MTFPLYSEPVQDFCEKCEKLETLYWFDNSYMCRECMKKEFLNENKNQKGD